MSRERVVVIGASGFGRECLDTVEAMRAAGADVEIVGVIDDSPSTVNVDRLSARGIRLLGSIESFVAEGDKGVAYVVGIGSPEVRRRIVERLDEAGYAAFTAVHPATVIGSQTSFADGVVVCAGAVVSTNVRLGRHVHINPNATIGHDAVLGDFVSVNPAAVISGEVTVGEASLIGAASTILQGLSVGARAVVGAGSVVTKDVPSTVVTKGVPARWPAVVVAQECEQGRSDERADLA